MTDQFDTYELKPEKLVWIEDKGNIVARTTRGDYTIKQKHLLFFRGKGMLSNLFLGTFKNPKDKAREHYNNEA